MNQEYIIYDDGYLKITNNVIFKTVKEACKNWHYSKTCPSNNIFKFGVYEEGVFIGVVLFGYGANYMIAQRFGMQQGEVIELTRIALDFHKTPVSQILSKIIKYIKVNHLEIKILISYADEGQGHSGQIYKAGGWIYDGLRKMSGYDYFYNDKWTHQKTLWDKAGSNTKDFKEFVKNLPKRKKSNKHRFIYYLNKRYKKKFNK